MDKETLVQKIEQLSDDMELLHRAVPHLAFFGGGVACRDGDGRRERQRLQPLAGLGRFTHRDSYKFRSTLRLY